MNLTLNLFTSGAISWVLVQLPGVCLGFYGISKAFINDGFSKEAMKNALRFSYQHDFSFLKTKYLDPLHFS